jgi:hypothetical protein
MDRHLFSQKKGEAMRNAKLFDYLQIENAPRPTPLKQTPITITMLPTDLLKCNGSSNIEKLGYCDRSQILEIHFHSGGCYRYYNVPVTVFHGMVAAQSTGRYFHQRIRNQYDYEKIN